MSASTRFRPIGRSLAASALVLGAIVGATTADATQRTWTPGASPCGPLLQNCINFATAGDTINIAFTGTISGGFTITKSLTLRAAGTHTPLFNGFPTIFLFNEVGDVNTIGLDGLEFDRARIVAIQESIHPFVVSLRDIGMSGSVNGFANVTVRTNQASGPFGPINATIQDSRFTTSPETSKNEVLSLQSGIAHMTALVRNNVINHFNGGQLGAIALFNNTGHMTADVICNFVRGDNYNNGIQYSQQGAGTGTIRFLGNFVSGQVNDAGMPCALGISISEGEATFEIVNNTVYRCDRGIGVSGADEIGAAWSGIISNNIVATLDSWGFAIEQPNLTEGVVENDHNLVYETGTNFFVPGPGTVFDHPQLAADQYHINDNSPARNAGNDARVPVDLTVDLDGNARMIGHVDIGADESTVTVSTPPDVRGVYALEPNVPNPFNPTTVIRYRLPRAEQVFLGVYDAAGGLVRWLLQGDARGPGMHSATWDGRDERGVSMASGIYFYRMTAGSFTESHRMVLVR